MTTPLIVDSIYVVTTLTANANNVNKNKAKQQQQQKFSSLLIFSGENVNVNRLYSLFALEVIMKAAFGFDTDLQRNPDEAFVEKARNVFNMPLWVRAFSMFPFWTYLSRYVNIFSNADFFISLAKQMLKHDNKWAQPACTKIWYNWC